MLPGEQEVTRWNFESVHVLIKVVDSGSETRNQDMIGWRCGGFEKKSWEPSVKKQNMVATTEEPRDFHNAGICA